MNDTHYYFDAAGNRTNMVEIIGSATNMTGYAANSDNQLTSATATRTGIILTGYVEPGPSSNKWYASVARAGGQQSAVSSQNGTFAIPGVPVTGGANALTVTVTDVSGNIATQIVNVTVASAATVLGYDANGNQTNDATWSYTYDRENRLVSATNSTATINYGYDALGRLIERRTSGASVTTNRMYYAGWQLLAEYNGSGALQRKYVYGPGIDEPICITAGSKNYFYHADGLGSVTEVTDNSGLKTESYSYDVYGTPTMYNSGGGVIGGSAIGNRLLFIGRDRDPDTALYNCRYRYYSANLGRFVQVDPIRTRGGDSNLYRYCLGNPVNAVDPFGFSTSGEAYDYWVGVASRGIDEGGLAGYLQAGGASLMTSFIDFFGARGVEESAEKSGAAWGMGCYGESVKYGLLTAGQIGVSALAGWTGGGGAAATEVRTLRQAWFYEVGSQTIKGEVFQGIKSMSAVERGEYLLKTYGLKEVLFKRGALKPSIWDWLRTIPQGPTPGGYLANMLLRQGILSSQSKGDPCPCSTQ